MSGSSRAGQAPAVWIPKLFTGEDNGRDDPPDVATAAPPPDDGTPLRQHFLQYVVPQHLADNDPSTIEEFLTTIKYWEQATDNAPVERWRGGMPAFAQWLKETPYRGKLRAPATRRKHLIALQYLLDLAGPSSRDRDAAGLIEQPARIRRPKGSASINKRPLDVPEIARYLEACQHATWERKGLPLPACAFWRCLGLFLYQVGLRIETVYLLRWEWLQEDADGHSWLEIPPAAMKRDERFRCYVSPAALRALAPLRQLERPLIFPFPFVGQTARRKLTELYQRAEIPLRGLQENKFHAFRRSCAVELAKINPYASKMQLGHSTRDVTLNHYVSPAVLIDAHQRLPQPNWSGDFFGRQRRLF